MIVDIEDNERNLVVHAQARSRGIRDLQAFADDAIATASLGFRFIKDDVMEETEAVKKVVKELGNPLMVGAVDPDDPEKGLEAFRKALKDAGIDKIIEEAQTQYTTWKESLK